MLDEECGNSRFFVSRTHAFADSRLWMNVLAAHGAVPRTSLPVRNPMEVARSLAARNGFEPALGRLMWLRHVLEAEHATRGRSRFFTSYDNLLKNWASITVGASEALEVSWPCQPARVDANVATFLDKKYRHHEEAVNDTLGNPKLVDVAARCLSCFCGIGRRPERSRRMSPCWIVSASSSTPLRLHSLGSSRPVAKRCSGMPSSRQNKKSLTDAVQVGERTIVELRTKLEELEKNAAAQAAKAAELEGTIVSTRKKLVVQNTAISRFPRSATH